METFKFPISNGMRIAYFTDTYLPQINGVVTSIRSFRKEAIKSGNTVYLFAPKISGAKNDDDKTYRFPSVQSLAYPDIRESFPVNPKIISMIIKLKFDIFHIQSPGQVGLLGTWIAKRYNIPQIFSYHTLYPDYFSTYRKAVPTFILGAMVYPLIVNDPSVYKEFIKIAGHIKNKKNWMQEVGEKVSAIYCNQMDAVIAPSPKMKRLLLEWGVKKPIQVIPTGIDLTEFKSKSQNIKNEYHVEDKKIITFLGRLGYEKNLILLLEAFKKIHKNFPDVILFIAGSGPAKESLKKKSRNLGISGSVVFTGFLDRLNVVSLLKSSEMFVFPSTTDTQGIAVLEAAACGLPIVMIDKEINSALVNGKNGYFAKNDAGDFAKKMSLILGNEQLRKNFSQYSPKLAKEYSASKVNKKLLAFYKEIIHG